jgi:DNA-binding SARP family transcriptional activator/class 3 adenylate cyclase
MEFRILGPLEVQDEGSILPLPGGRHRAVLALLLLHANEVVPTDRLIDELWGDEPAENAATALYGYIWQLRKALGGDDRRQVLVTRAPGYVIELEPDQLDATRLEQLVRDGREALREGDPVRAASALHEALALWRGPALADFAYESFAQAEILRLEELHLAALEERIEADLALGGHADVVGELEVLAAKHPLRERLRAELMLALYRTGRQAEALAAYQAARRALVEELGIEPGRELQALQTAILRHDPILDLGPTSEPVDAALAAPISPAEPPPPREERKVVTVLFAGFGGFTARSDLADPEDMRARLRPFHAAATREIERHGGTVGKFIGDAVVAVFGAPVAHEDDAERAVRTALAVRDWIEEEGQDSQVRIAVNTGVALVSLGSRPHEGEAMAAGDVVNTAQRMQATAPANGILVGAQTYRATYDVIDYREAEPIEATGKSEPIPAWAALEARSRLGVDLLREPRAPLVGRQPELDLLVSLLARVRDERSPQLVTLVGVPGIGKSRLVFELFNKVEQDRELITWRQGRCLPYGEGVSLWALGEMVKAQAGILESDSPKQASEKLSAEVAIVVEDGSEREWLNTRLAPLVGAQLVEAPGTAERAESFTAWRRFLEGLADIRPLVLVFEDLHWADEGLLDFADELADRVRDAPLLILCTARPELLGRRPGWGGGKANALTISLPPLSDDETASVVAAVLEQRVLEAEVQEALLARAAGNPLYAEQFARVLAEVGALDELPETVQGIIAARLDGLLAEEKALLQDAAVVGKVFWLGALEAIGGVSRRQAEELLYGLERKEFVHRARRSSIAGETEYVFRHVLLRDVAYGQIPRAARAAKHRGAARWIERIAEGRVTDHAEILADHYGQALELFRAAGDGDKADELEAPYRRSLVMAGDRAFQLDVAKAESYYSRTLEIVPSGHPQRATVLTKAAEAAWLAGNFSEAEARHEEAIAELRAKGNALALGGALLSLSLVHGFRGETRRARALLDEVVAVLEREPRGPELARAYAQKAREHMLSENYAESLSWSEKALALAEELGRNEVAVMALQFRGLARSGLGDPGGLDDLREALRAGREFGLGLETARVHVNLASVVWLAEGPAAALEVQRAGIDFGERRGITSVVLWTKGMSLWTLFDLGDWAELLQVADELISWDRLRGGSYFGVIALCSKAQVLLRRGRLEEAASLSDEFLPRARRIEDPQVLAPALAVAAMIEEARDNREAALALIEEGGVPPSATLEGGTFVHEAVRLCAATGALGVAECLLEGRRATLTRHRHGLVTAGATLAEAHGRLEEAANLYADAAQRWAEYGFALEHSQALLGLGRCRHALGRADANGPLAAARELFARLGARRLAAETDDLLAKALPAGS